MKQYHSPIAEETHLKNILIGECFMITESMNYKYAGIYMRTDKTVVTKHNTVLVCVLINDGKLVDLGNTFYVIPISIKYARQ